MKSPSGEQERDAPLGDGELGETTHGRDPLVEWVAVSVGAGTTILRLAPARAGRRAARRSGAGAGGRARASIGAAGLLDQRKVGVGDAGEEAPDLAGCSARGIAGAGSPRRP